MENLKRIIVIGASAGGFKAITELALNLPENLPTAIFFVLHMGKASSAEIIRAHLAKHTSYTCRIPKDGEAIEPGNIYIAPPDLHMLLKPNVIRLVKSPHENRWRPSIDVLFRSAAVAFNSATIGIVLSGMLDDGTSGMTAIKRCGGTCIVQEPIDAEYDDMPINVINMVDVDHRAPIADIGYILDDVFTKPIQHVQIPEDIRIEAEITERMAGSLEDMAKIGTHSNFTCPDCGGGLWKINNEKAARYRCHTGHVYTEKLLMEKQTEELEESVWVCIRMMEERRNLLLNMAYREGGRDHLYAEANQRQRADDMSVHIERLKGLLLNINKNGVPDEGYL
jgi:two-component system chemotaxis response regulator CheB